MKQITRLKNLAKRNSLSKKEIEEKSNAIQKLVEELPEFKKAKCIILYYGVNNEVETNKLIEKAIALEKRVALPATNFEKRAMVPREINSLEELKETTQGLFEPKTQKPVESKEIDLIIIPGVAFDKAGSRIGRGMGFYDSLLRKTSTKTPLVGLCFEENLEESIPTESHDVKMDIVITDKETIRCK